MDIKINTNTVIAVVEDDESILDAVSIILESKGWDVRAYSTGEAFLDATRSSSKENSRKPRSPDFLILDPHLPGINGDEVLEQLAEYIDRGDIHIIILTAHPNGPKTLALHDMGVDDVLLKPVTQETLIHSISKYL